MSCKQDKRDRQNYYRHKSIKAQERANEINAIVSLIKNEDLYDIEDGRNINACELFYPDKKMPVDTV